MEQILFTYEFEDRESLEAAMDELFKRLGGRGENGYSSYMSMTIDIHADCPDIETAKEICEEFGTLYSVEGSIVMAG